MVFSKIMLILILVTQLHCSHVGNEKRWNEYLDSHYAADVGKSIIRNIRIEVRARENTISDRTPPGYVGADFDESEWQEFWNRRIYNLYRLEDRPGWQDYEGPSGLQFIEIIIRERRAKGLPELILEERNKGKVPAGLMNPDGGD